MKNPLSPTSSAPDPLAPVTAQEVAAIMDDPRFCVAGYDESKVKDAMSRVRERLDSIDFKALPFGSRESHHVRHDLCRPLDNQLEQAGVEKKVLKDEVILAVRSEIGLRISLRVRLGSHPQFRDLCRVIKERKGNISIGSLKQDEKTILIAHVLITLTCDFGQRNGVEGRKLGWELVAEFLKQQTGAEKVTFEGQHFVDRDKKSEEAEGAEDDIKIPELKIANAALRRVENAKTELSASVEAALDDLEAAMSAIKRKKEELERQKGDSERFLATAGDKLKPYFDAKHALDGAEETDRCTSAIRKGENPDTFSLPPRIKGEWNKQRAALKKQYDGQGIEKFEECEQQIKELTGQIEACVEHLRSLHSKKIELLALRRKAADTVKPVQESSTENLFAAVPETPAAAIPLQKERPAGQLNTRMDLWKFVSKRVTVTVTSENTQRLNVARRKDGSQFKIGDSVQFVVLGASSNRIQLRPIEETLCDTLIITSDDQVVELCITPAEVVEQKIETAPVPEGERIATFEALKALDGKACLLEVTKETLAEIERAGLTFKRLKVGDRMECRAGNRLGKVVLTSMVRLKSFIEVGSGDFGKYKIFSAPENPES